MGTCSLLEILNVINVVVVVSRWYGGIQLGPDRFKHINNCARNALDRYQFIKSDSDKVITALQLLYGVSFPTRL